MPENPGQTIAILDDDPSVREALVSLLNANGFTTESFSDASTFLNCSCLEKFACLVLDLRLQGMGGLELQRHLAAEGRRVSIIFITAHGTPENREQALHAGATDFLSKPFSEDALLRAVRRGLEKAQNFSKASRAKQKKAMKKIPLTFHTTQIEDVKVFFRQAGNPNSPAILLLHGFPTSSHMFRDLIPRLADEYHIVAPDLPGFGNTAAPAREKFRYTFDNLARIIGDFVEAIGLNRFAIYVFDYGAPTGFRLALAKPERIAAIISQNGNAYLEGFSDAWTVWQNYWKHPTAENREACRESLSPRVIREIQYLHGADAERVSPDGYTLDIAYMARPGAEEIQLDLILDYQSNPEMYPAFQKFFRERQLPTLAVWGKNDLHFLPAGAEAYRRDNANAKVVFYDTGHFALETHSAEIGDEIRDFLKTVFVRDESKSLTPKRSKRK